MFPVTIIIIALHLVLALRLLVKRYPQKVVNTANEPALLQIFLCGIAIVLLSAGSDYHTFGKSAVGLILAGIAWLISMFSKHKKVSGE